MTKDQIFHQGIVCPLDKNNVDTDQIIPKQFLTSVERDGFDKALFFDWRYLDDGQPNPEFVLNFPQYKGASVLLTRENFGCGSSREHAPWAPELMEVALLTSNQTKATAEYYLDQAEAYLNAHSITNIKKIWTSQNIVQSMREKYLDWATVVVVGAHSKKGLLNFMTGGLTKYLIKEARKPVLIGQ